MPAKTKKPWESAMPAKQFDFMRTILDAPSPIGHEGSMTYGVLKPYLEKLKLKSWKIHQFKGNAGIVLDTDPGDDSKCSFMIIGHADKIRMQVRSIGEDGKIWINTDSFLPTTLIGHEVKLFSEDPKSPGKYRIIQGGTIEAIGAIHFADASLRAGNKGIKGEMMYLELQIHGDDPQGQVKRLGIRPGDSMILDRPIKRGFSKHSFYGAYLDNGLGCFVVAELAKLVAKAGGLDNIRLQFAMATHEEIGRFGSTAMVGELRPDVILGVDVNHDYGAAPGIGHRRMTPLTMGQGFSLTTGSVTSEFLNAQIQIAAKAAGIPVQKDVAGRDTGTDAMAAALAGVDAASTSIGFPIRNMHTISETGHTGDVLAAIYGLEATFKKLNRMNRGKGVKADDFRNNHTRLDKAKSLTSK